MSPQDPEQLDLFAGFNIETKTNSSSKDIKNARPLPLIIADKCAFPLQFHVIGKTHWFSLQDWLRGVMQKPDVRRDVVSVKENASRIEYKKMPYSATSSKVYQMDYVDISGLKDITYRMRSGTGIRNLVIEGFYRVSTERGDSSLSTVPTQANTPPNHTGFVYLIQSPSGAFKIGRSKDPNNRMATFSVKLPFEVEFTALIPTENAHALERQLHIRYADKRVNGEWFNLSPDDVEYIKSLTGGE